MLIFTAEKIKSFYGNFINFRKIEFVHRIKFVAVRELFSTVKLVSYLGNNWFSGCVTLLQLKQRIFTRLNINLTCLQSVLIDFQYLQGSATVWWYGDFSISQDSGRRHLGFSKFEIYNGRKGQEGWTASPCQISSKSLEPRPRYCDFSIFQDSDSRHLGF